MQRYQQIVATGVELVEQVTGAQFALGDLALEIEPMRAWGSPEPCTVSEPEFTVKVSLQRFADDIGVSERTVTAWRWTAAKWPAAKRRKGISFTVHRILGSVVGEAERWASLDDPPFNERSGRRQWTPDGAKRLLGHKVDIPVTVEEKIRAVTDLTRDDKVAAAVTADLLLRPAAAAQVSQEDRVRVVAELTRDDEVAKKVTTDLLRRPQVAREAMRDDTARLLVNRAQFDNSERARETLRERVPAVRKIEHTIEYLDLVGSCHSYVASLGRLVPRLRGQEFTEDERETVRRGIARVRAAADWLESAIDAGVFTLDEQLAQLLKGE
ncbi:DUF6192 family protein [Streptomyces sp. NPDC058655]|uniref:DUF6192 family protein n=1 Tax=Streptomyces sp. NPDC058655 TaxID=3346577 RepID=UPI00364FAB73